MPMHTGRRRASSIDDGINRHERDTWIFATTAAISQYVGGHAFGRSCAAARHLAGGGRDDNGLLPAELSDPADQESRRNRRPCYREGGPGTGHDDFGRKLSRADKEIVAIPFTALQVTLKEHKPTSCLISTSGASSRPASSSIARKGAGSGWRRSNENR